MRLTGNNLPVNVPLLKWRLFLISTIYQNYDFGKEEVQLLDQQKLQFNSNLLRFNTTSMKQPSLREFNLLNLIHSKILN